MTDEEATILADIAARMQRLQEYVNSKELNELQNLKTRIENGIEARLQVRWFLLCVPEGAYDADRRRYPYPRFQ